jgi:hypothetical protein
MLLWWKSQSPSHVMTGHTVLKTLIKLHVLLLPAVSGHCCCRYCVISVAATTALLLLLLLAAAAAGCCCCC